MQYHLNSNKNSSTSLQKLQNMALFCIQATSILLNSWKERGHQSAFKISNYVGAANVLLLKLSIVVGL